MDYMDSIILDGLSKLTKVPGFRSKGPKNTGKYERSVSASELKNINNIEDVNTSLGNQTGYNYDERKFRLIQQSLLWGRRTKEMEASSCQENMGN